ncbi:MAG: molybdopterin-binding oxidoreductase, partial [Ilumatobacteraceae bacterium]
MGVRLYAAARSIGIGPLVGVVSTALGLGVGELVAGLVREASSPVVPVGQEVIDVVPPAVKDWAIAWFGTADKAVLILGTLLVLLVVGSIVGAMAMRGRLAAAVVVSSIVGVAGVAAVLARPAPTVGKVLPPVLGTLCSVGVLWWFAVRAAIDSGEQEGDDPVVAVDRRSVVRAVGVTAALAAMSAVIG